LRAPQTFKQEKIFRFCLSIRRRAALSAAAVFTGQDGPFQLLISVFGEGRRSWGGACSAKLPMPWQTMLFTISTRSESRQSATILTQGAFEFVNALGCNWKACYGRNGALRMVVCGTRGSIQDWLEPPLGLGECRPTSAIRHQCVDR
jgi:hypothetical protein